MPFARRHRLALELALIAIVGYLAAAAVSAAVRLTTDPVVPPPLASDAEPETTPRAPLAAYAVIAERDLFDPGAGRRATAPVGLRLWGVALHGDAARAVIEDTATGRQDIYGVGDQVGGVRIAAIDWDRVTLAGSGGETMLELAPAPVDEPAEAAPAATPGVAAPASEERIRRTGENAFVVDRRELTGADSMSGLLTQLRAVAEVRDGRPAGFRLFQVREGSLFARLGLRDGDVVQRVNGSAVSEPAALLGFLQRLGREPRVALDIVRGDAPRTLVYDLR